MAKIKTFYGNEAYREKFDTEISIFLEELEKNGHAFISLNTISFSKHSGYIDTFRTEILYQENQTRKVISEKLEKN